MILLFIDMLGSGGAQRQLVGLAALLKNAGKDVKVCTYYPHDFYKKDLESCGIKCELIPGAGNAWKRIIATYKYFQKERPDWVISYLETPSLVACAARLLGCKYKLIVSERNTTQTIGLNERVRFLLFRCADAIVPNSFSQEKWLAEHYPWMHRKITTIPNFVDLDHFAFVDHDRQEVPEIMVAATVWPSKNTLGFIEAVSIIKSRNVKCHIKWYGVDERYMDYYAKCKELVARYDVSDYIELVPKTKEINKCYQSADYFCLPSFYEGTPNVICEAISTGLPVMCSDICDNPHYVSEGVNGVLFDPKSPQDIADKIIQLLGQSDQDYSRARMMSRKVAEERLNSTKFIDNYLMLMPNAK